MKFLAMMFNNESAWERMSKSEQDAAVKRLFEFDDVLRKAGKLVCTYGLTPSREGVSIRDAAGDGRAVTDGPFCETKEVMGGFYVLECASKQEALEWAKKIPLASWGVELRQIGVED